MTDPPHAGDETAEQARPGSVANFRTTALREPDARRMLVVPSLGLRASSAGLVAVGLGLPAFHAVKDGVTPDLFGTALFAQIFTAAGVLFWALPRRVEFDLDAGVARSRSFRAREELPLSEATAVEVADGGVHQMSKGGRYRSYRLDLVLTGGRRLGLSNHGHRGWTYDAGRRLAVFLGLPFVDAAADEEAGGPGHAG